MDGIPPKVSISEGVEIAKLYSTEDSSSFINGILEISNFELIYVFKFFKLIKLFLINT